MVIRIENETFPSNTYLICQEIDNTCIIIDPGLDEALVDQKIVELKLKPLAIISTHGHFDHIGGVSFFHDKYSIPFYIHKEDLKLYKSANFYLKLNKIERFIKIIEPDFLLAQEKQKLNLGEFCIEVFNYPGHTRGSCIVKHESNIFTGDTILKKGLYLNKLPEENVEMLKESVLEITNTFDLHSICYPGHGDKVFLYEINNLLNGIC